MFSEARRVNKRKAGDLIRHRAHYDVTVMGSDLELGCGSNLTSEIDKK